MEFTVQFLVNEIQSLECNLHSKWCEDEDLLLFRQGHERLALYNTLLADKIELERLETLNKIQKGV